MANSRKYSVSSGFVRFFQYAQMLFLVAILLPKGAVEATPLHLLATLSFIITALAVLVQNKRPPALSALVAAFFIALFLTAWICLQASDLLPGLANPIWQDVNRLIGPAAGSISVAPSDTLQGIVAVVLPFSVFISSALLFESDEDVHRLIRFIGISGGIISIFSLIQFLAFPDTLMFGPKRLYLDSLTATFVNRNSAATYLGAIMITSTALCFHHVQNGGVLNFWRRLIGGRSATRTNDLAMALVYIVCFAAAMSALLLTKSRAGTAAAFLGLIVMSVILAYHGSYRAATARARGFSNSRTLLRIKLGRALAVFLIFTIGGLVLSGRALFRAEAQGAEDGRFCIMPGLLRLTSDHWLTGSGLGVFRMVFPAYRDPACGIYGVWERAHNFYLDGWIALGIIFGVAALIIVLGLFAIFVRGLNARKQYRWAPALGLGLLLQQMLHNVVDFSIQMPGVAVIFSALMGGCASVSLVRMVKTKKAKSDQRSELQNGAVLS